MRLWQLSRATQYQSVAVGIAELKMISARQAPPKSCLHSGGGKPRTGNVNQAADGVQKHADEVELPAAK